MDGIIEIFFDNLTEKLEDNRLTELSIPYIIEIGLANGIEPFYLLKMESDKCKLLKQDDEETEPDRPSKDSMCKDKVRDR